VESLKFSERFLSQFSRIFPKFALGTFFQHSCQISEEFTFVNFCFGFSR
jgi:hypothetical protein